MTQTAAKDIRFFSGIGSPTNSPYDVKLLGMSPIAYWKLNEPSGVTALDSSGNGLNGTYVGATPAGSTFIDGTPTPSFDGINDLVNVFSAGLAALFNGNLGTISAWIQIPTLAIWNDASTRLVFYFQAATVSNFIRAQKRSGGTGLSCSHTGGGTTRTIAPFYNQSNWFSLALRWDVTGNSFTVWLNGVIVSTLGGLVTFVNPITLAIIGAVSLIGGSPHQGSIAKVAVWNTRLTDAQLAALGTL